MKSFIRQMVDSCINVAAVIYQVYIKISASPRRFYYLTQLRAMVVGIIPVTTQFDGPALASWRANIWLGAHCRLGQQVFFETTGAGRIVVGAHVRINSGTLIASHTQITIGNDCLIGEYVSIRDANHSINMDQPIRLQASSSAPIVIGQGVWIGRGAVILKGVHIGDNAVIGANSVVTKDVPAFAVMGGVPARVIKWRNKDSAI